MSDEQIIEQSGDFTAQNDARLRQLFPEDNEKQDPFERVDNDENDRLLDREGSPDFKPKKKKKGKLKSNAEE